MSCGPMMCAAPRASLGEARIAIGHLEMASMTALPPEWPDIGIIPPTAPIDRNSVYHRRAAGLSFAVQPKTV